MYVFPVYFMFLPGRPHKSYDELSFHCGLSGSLSSMDPKPHILVNLLIKAQVKMTIFGGISTTTI